MDHFELFSLFKNHYVSLSPHHDTWIMWTKDDKTTEEFFEVAIGTILVQNTNWKNVNQALENLRFENVFSFKKIYSCGNDKLIELIKPAGFFNQKMSYLKAISKLFLDLKHEEINRDVLLKTKGIGRETADSILNFCLRRPVPDIGTYTKRFFASMTGDSKYLSKKYEFIQEEILSSFEDQTAYSLGMYHALIVAHSQNICTKVNPKCDMCFLTNCSYKQSKITGSEVHIIIDKKINPQEKKKKVLDHKI